MSEPADVGRFIQCALQSYTNDKRCVSVWAQGNKSERGLAAQHVSLHNYEFIYSFLAIIRFLGKCCSNTCSEHKLLIRSRTLWKWKDIDIVQVYTFFSDFLWKMLNSFSIRFFKISLLDCSSTFFFLHHRCWEATSLSRVATVMTDSVSTSSDTTIFKKVRNIVSSDRSVTACWLIEEYDRTYGFYSLMWLYLVTFTANFFKFDWRGNFALMNIV